MSANERKIDKSNKDEVSNIYFWFSPFLLVEATVALPSLINLHKSGGVLHDRRHRHSCPKKSCILQRLRTERGRRRWLWSRRSGNRRVWGGWQVLPYRGLYSAVSSCGRWNRRRERVSPWTRLLSEGSWEKEHPHTNAQGSLQVQIHGKLLERIMTSPNVEKTSSLRSSGHHRNFSMSRRSWMTCADFVQLESGFRQWWPRTTGDSEKYAASRLLGRSCFWENFIEVLTARIGLEHLSSVSLVKLN